ncbi:PQQ-binding-like beta-propeller repeat protein [Streptomyces sp. NPDC091215]|uniref:outer membrane protein assembly factor BamB family protein n=1 Tax=Streptomyces sp. NPDC091215 TaxID=3155192 RepID=UPI00342F6552
MEGRLLRDRYRLQKRLGQGGMGQVWVAHDPVVDRLVAVKVLLEQPGADLGDTTLFLREAQTAGRLRHPNVITVHDAGQDDDGTLFLVMELLAGRDLAGLLGQDGPPPVGRAVDWAAQIADALDAAHTAGVIHRDLKPANLMLAPTGTVTILDFGIARYTATLTQASRVIGTLAYMPPERLRGKVGDGRGDLYSLGCLLHELLTGQPPFHGLEQVALIHAHLETVPPLPSTLRPGIPVGLDRLISELLAKDPAHRPATAADVRDRLRSLHSACLQAAPHPPTAAAPTPPATQPAGQSPPKSPDEPRPAPAPLTPVRRRTLLAGLGLTLTAGAGIGVRSLIAGLSSPPVKPPTTRTRWTAHLKKDNTPIAVADGILYLKNFTDQISRDDTMYALDAATGHTRWTHPIGAGMYFGLAVAHGTIYTGGHGQLQALDATAGHTRWTHPVGDEVSLPPVVADGTVYISDNDGLVYALEEDSGGARWTYQTGGGPASLVLTGGVVYAANDKVYALDAATGHTRWTYPTGESADLSPVVDGIIYASSYANGKVYALDAATGRTRWTHQVGGRPSSAPVVHGRVVYMGSGDDWDNKMYALDAATGHTRWTHPTGGRALYSPVVDGDVVCIGDADGMVYALDAATGHARWNYQIRDRTGGFSAAVAHGVIYLGGTNGMVWALEVATGHTQWSHHTGYGDTSLVMAGGVVYVGSDTDGEVYALDAVPATRN